MKMVGSLLLRYWRWTPLAGIILWPLMNSCGGGGNSAAPPRSAAPSAAFVVPEGLWDGTFQDKSGETSKAQALVLANGEAWLAAEIDPNHGSNIQAKRIIIKDKNDDYKLKSNALTMFKFQDGIGNGKTHVLGFGHLKCNVIAPPATFTLTEVGPRQHFSGNYKTEYDSGNYHFNRYNPVYDKPCSHADLEGDYVGRGWIRTIGKKGPHGGGISTTHVARLPMVLGADGSFRVIEDDKHKIEGTCTLPDPAKAGLQFAFTFTPLDEPGAQEHFRGIGVHVANADSGKHWLTVTAIGDSGGVMGLEFQRPM